MFPFTVTKALVVDLKHQVNQHGQKKKLDQQTGKRWTCEDATHNCKADSLPKKNFGGQDLDGWANNSATSQGKNEQ